MTDHGWSANFSDKFCGEKVPRGQCGGTPTVVNIGFLERNRYFRFQFGPELSS
jgi:hypothetical protein